MVSALTDQLKEKSIKVRIAVFHLLKQVIGVLDHALAGHVAAFVPGITFCLTDKSANSNLRTEALLFLRLLLESQPAEEFQSHFADISGPVYAAVHDPFYKITAEALRVCTAFVPVLRPSDMTEFNYQPHVKPLFAACQSKLVAQDIDQEVKEAAILCAAAVVANLGNELGDELAGALRTLSDRLSNEITRLTAVRAIRQIAASSLRIDLSSVLREVTENLALFLRKSHRKLKQASLTALEVIVRNYGTHEAVASQLSSVIRELAPHIKYVLSLSLSLSLSLT